MTVDFSMALDKPSPGEEAYAMTSSVKVRPTRAKQRGASAGAERLGKEAWVEAGRSALIRGGVAAVKVDPIAGTMGVTTGSFYWHFKDRQELLDAVLKDWERTNSQPMFAAVENAGDDPEDQFIALCKVWLEENDYDPLYDSAIREWARTSTKVETAVRRVDERRIGLLTDIFRTMGDTQQEAFIRARIVYFHQVGYYTLHIRETAEQRLKLLPIYIRLLLGRPSRRLRRS